MFPGIEKKYIASQKRQTVFLSISLGALFWIIDSLVDSFIFDEGIFTTLLFHPPLHETWVRFFTIGVIIIALYARFIILIYKKIEPELRENKERYRLLFQRSPVGIFHYDKDLRITECNDRFIEIAHLPPGKIIGLELKMSKKEKVLLALKKALDGVEGVYEGLCDLSMGDDKTWVFLRTAPLFGPNNEVRSGIGIVEDITEQKKTEATLHKSEENLRLYQALINQSNDSVEVLDPETGYFLNVNNKTCTDLGYSRKELLSMKVFDIDPTVNPSDFPKILEDLRRTGGGIWNGVHLRKDGSTFPVEVSLKVVQLDRSYIVAVARDVTERKRADEALREKEMLLSESQQIAHIGTWHYDMTGRILWSEEAYRIYGVSPDTFTPNPESFINLIHPDDRSAMQAWITTCMAGEKSGELDFRTVLPDGSVHFLRGRGELKHDADNRPAYMAGTVQDITEQKKIEDKLFQITHDWEDTFNSITDMVTVHDKDFNIIHANKAAWKILNLPILNITPQKCYRFYHGTDRPPDGCPSCNCLNTGLPVTVELYEPHLKMFIEITAIPRFDSNNNVAGLIHIVRDITERKKLEDQLRQSQKMEAVGQLAGGIAHDFNNVLTAIIGYANILKLRLKDDPVKSNIDQILESSERGAHLTQSLLAFSRQQVSNPEPVDVIELISNMEKLLLRVIGEDIELTTILNSVAPDSSKKEPGGDGTLIIMADSIQIDQVLINLCTNARDAMPNGGRLTIETKKVALASLGFLKEEWQFHKSDNNTAGNNGEFAEISVSDTGIGMDEKTRERIFEPFFTTKDIGKGTGLGLSIVYGIIKQHNGYIVCDSKPGKGTTFKIYLPVIKADIIKTEIEEIPDTTETAHTILLAEDEFIVRNLTKQVLEEFGYKVIEAFDGEDAVNKFIDNKDNIELLIFDIIMPKMSGKEAYDRIRKIKPDIKALLTSGYPADFINKNELIKDGINFVVKPISPAKLLKRVKEVLAN